MYYICRFNYSTYFDCTNGFDIIRHDGLLATILIQGFYFVFHVWHDRFPDLKGLIHFRNWLFCFITSYYVTWWAELQCRTLISHLIKPFPTFPHQYIRSSYFDPILFLIHSLCTYSLLHPFICKHTNKSLINVFCSAFEHPRRFGHTMGYCSFRVETQLSPNSVMIILFWKLSTCSM